MQIARSVHPLPGESEREARLLKLLDAFPGRRVAIIGDLIADEFIYGRVARVSREAPVLILQYDSTEILPGGAGNAANNVSALGARAQLDRRGGPRRRRKAPAHRLQTHRRQRHRSSGRISDAGQDPDSCRRCALRQAANRPHRSRGVHRLRFQDAGGLCEIGDDRGGGV